MTKLRLALINTGELPSEVIKAGGRQLEQYNRAFSKAAQRQGIEITWEEFDALNTQYPSLDDIEKKKYDAIVVSGSTYSAHENDPWILQLVEYLQTLLASYSDKVKIVGCCFGHQIVSRAAGGKTGRNEAGWEAGVLAFQLNEEGKKTLNTDKDIVKLYEFHQDHVYCIPQHFKKLGFSKGSTPIQLIVSENGQFIGIQGHVEYNRETLLKLIEYNKKEKIFDSDFADRKIDALKNAPHDLDDVWLIEKVFEFILN